jgi:hypothetical protein
MKNYLNIFSRAVTAATLQAQAIPNIVPNSAQLGTVGSGNHYVDLMHQEYWIPAAALPAFNAAIMGRIEVIAEFHRAEQA